MYFCTFVLLCFCTFVLLYFCTFVFLYFLFLYFGILKVMEEELAALAELRMKEESATELSVGLLLK